MRHIAIIGSGPAGYYTAEALLRLCGDAVRIDILDRLPVPFGLIRSGVAPDHQSIKAVARRYEAVAQGDAVRFIGNVSVGVDVTVPELTALYDAVVLATGAPTDRPLAIAGDTLPGVIGSAAFVGWYNGHPDHALLNPPLDGERAVIIGNGNVALDVARILAKQPPEFAGSDIVAHALAALTHSRIRHITLLGRRGPYQIAMTPKELSELGNLADARPMVSSDDLPDPALDEGLDAGVRKSVALLRSFAATDPDQRTRTIQFRFFAQPVAIQGKDRAEAVIVERTRITPDDRAVGTGEHITLPASLVISCIGYRTPPIPDVPYDDRTGRFANQDGLISPGLYAVGWARRGPSGTIGTNRPDGVMIADRIVRDIAADSGKDGPSGLDALLAGRNIPFVTFADWQRIDAAEIARARSGSPREKFVALGDFLSATKP